MARKLFIERAVLYSKLLERIWEQRKITAEFLHNYFHRNSLEIKEILDVPCGIGRLSIPLAQLGYQVVGVDISDYFLEIAKLKGMENKVEVKFIKGKMKYISSYFKDKKFV